MNEIRMVRYEGDLQPLVEWANIPSPQALRKNLPPDPFITWVKELQPKEHSCIKFWVSKIGAQKETLNDEWLQGFPHIHKNSMGWDPSIITMMLYLQEPESGGEIGVGGYSKDDPYTFLKPKPGLALFVDAIRWHGVKPVLSGERLAIIATGFPPE